MATKDINRRFFIQAAATSSIIALLPSLKTTGQNQQRPDPLKPELVKDFVTKGHNDMEGVKRLLEETAGLLNATWDWGGGDFETALGGAGHMGRTDIAEFLLAKGARLDIFVASMLGKLDIVKSIVDAYPDVLKSKGPHGITLLFHAEKGGEKSLSVVEFLKSKGLTK